MFSRASCRRCGLSAVLISVFLHSLGQRLTHAPQQGARQGRPIALANKLARMAWAIMAKTKTIRTRRS